MGSKCANKVTVFVEVPYTAYSLFNKLTCFENTCLGDTCTPESHLSSLNLIFQNINIKIVLDYKISTHINICISISVGKESACNAGDPGLTPELGRSLGEGLFPASGKSGS